MVTNNYIIILEALTNQSIYTTIAIYLQWYQTCQCPHPQQLPAGPA